MNKKYLYNAVLTNVVDGDTIDVSIDLGFNIFWKTRLRLNGIDAYEMHSTDPEKREKAKKGREILSKFIGQNVLIETTKPDKYGRYLADVWSGIEYLNHNLLKEGLAVPYDGGKKTI